MAARRLRFRSEHGASAVEFALISSLLLLILFGTIQFGIAYNRYQGLNAAAREGGRIASINATYDEIKNRTAAATSIIDTTTTTSPCPGTLTVDQFCVSVYWLDNAVPPNKTLISSSAVPPCDTAQTNNNLNPTVEVDASYRMRIQIPLFGNMTPTVTGTSVFRCER